MAGLPHLQYGKEAIDFIILSETGPVDKIGLTPLLYRPLSDSLLTVMNGCFVVIRASANCVGGCPERDRLPFGRDCSSEPRRCENASPS
jgi:hypothetical protein